MYVCHRISVAIFVSFIDYTSALYQTMFLKFVAVCSFSLSSKTEWISKTHKRFKRTLFNREKKDKMCEFSGKSSFSQLRTTQTVHLSFASWMLNLSCVFDLFSECWQPALFQIIKKIEWSFLLFGNITVVFKKCWWFIPNHGLYKFVYIYIMLALQYADYQKTVMHM